MKDIEYGISNVEVGSKISKVVKFGDGLTSIYSSFWGENFGLKLIRSEEINKVVEPFGFNKIGDYNWVDSGLVDDESVFIVFDNTKSIDAMIAQLNYVKDNWEQYKDKF